MRGTKIMKLSNDEITSLKNRIKMDKVQEAKFNETWPLHEASCKIKKLQDANEAREIFWDNFKRCTIYVVGTLISQISTALLVFHLLK